jgi:hypothetical protein
MKRYFMFGCVLLVLLAGCDQTVSHTVLTAIPAEMVDTETLPERTLTYPGMDTFSIRYSTEYRYTVVCQANPEHWHLIALCGEGEEWWNEQRMLPYVLESCAGKFDEITTIQECSLGPPVPLGPRQ